VGTSPGNLLETILATPMSSNSHEITGLIAKKINAYRQPSVYAA
jgi:hypothetical protein